MSEFTFTPAYSAQVNKKPRVRTAVFGDGYEQRVGDGINTIKRVWSLRFTTSSADIEAVDAFLTSMGGTTSFDWSPPSGAAGRWKCEEWDQGLDGYNRSVLTATFTEVFGE